MKRSVYLIALLWLSACSSKVLTPTQADADRVKSKYSDVTLESLNQGKVLFQTYCRSCHGLKSPTSRNEEKWRQIVPIMVKKVNKKNKSEVIDAQKESLILNYLLTMSTASGGSK